MNQTQPNTPPAEAKEAQQQATTCGKCGEHKHTPWRDNEYGYVCLGCLAKGFADRDKLAGENELLRSALGIQQDETIPEQKPQFGTILVDRRDGSRRRIAPATENEEKLAGEIAELKKRPRTERCEECGVFVSDWVEAQHFNGRICRPCEHNQTLRAELEAAKRYGEQSHADFCEAHRKLLDRTAELEAVRKERDELNTAIISTSCATHRPQSFNGVGCVECERQQQIQRTRLTESERDSALARAEAAEGLLRDTQPIIQRYASNHPKFQWAGVTQDPFGAHRILDSIALLTLSPASAQIQTLVYSDQQRMDWLEERADYIRLNGTEGAWDSGTSTLREAIDAAQSNASIKGGDAKCNAPAITETETIVAQDTNKSSLISTDSVVPSNTRPVGPTPSGAGLCVTPEMVDRVLAWPLPDTVCADLCATQSGAPNRSGTNLLTASEARAMLEYVLLAPPKATWEPSDTIEGYMVREEKRMMDFTREKLREEQEAKKNEKRP